MFRHKISLEIYSIRLEFLNLAITLRLPDDTNWIFKVVAWVHLFLRPVGAFLTLDIFRLCGCTERFYVLSCWCGLTWSHMLSHHCLPCPGNTCSDFPPFFPTVHLFIYLRLRRHSLSACRLTFNSLRACWGLNPGPHICRISIPPAVVHP